MTNTVTFEESAELWESKQLGATEEFVEVAGPEHEAALEAALQINNVGESRKLATVRRIEALEVIERADELEAAVVGGWKVVVRKGDYAVGDLAVYLEIDSWVPTDLAPFLSKGKEPKVYNEISGERLKTIKLRGQVSQGLLLPVSFKDDKPVVNRADGAWMPVEEDDDLTDFFGVLKWEAPESGGIQGARTKGNFPIFIPKTDQERVQNIPRRLAEYQRNRHIWEVTEKLDGSSMTVYFKDDRVGVCSRNLELDFDENAPGTFWSVALKNDLVDKLNILGENIAFQGELIGPGIQGE